MALRSKHINFLRLVAIFAGSAHLCACATWRLQTVGPTISAAFDSTKTYRVVLASGKRQVADHPVVSGDTLVWMERLPEASFVPAKRRGIPLSEIRQVEVQHTNMVVVLLVVSAAALALAATGLGQPNW
jgi:hypothetical protein